MSHEPHTPVKRKPLTALQRAKLFMDHRGMCCICKHKIGLNEKWIDEHKNPLGLTGTNEWENRGPAHIDCAREKTKGDVANIAKAKRREAKHLGARPKSKIKSRGFRPWADNTKIIERDFS